MLESMKLDLHQQIAPPDNMAATSVHQPYSPSGGVARFSSAQKEQCSPTITSAVALGVADLALNVSLHSGRVRATSHGPHSRNCAPPGGKNLQGIVAEQQIDDWCLHHDRQCSMQQQQQRVANQAGGLAVLAPASSACTDAHLTWESFAVPKEVIEASRAKRISPLELMQDFCVAVQNTIQVPNSPTVTRCGAVGLGTGKNSVDREQSAATEDVWIPYTTLDNVQPLHEDCRSSVKKQCIDHAHISGSLPRASHGLESKSNESIAVDENKLQETVSGCYTPTSWRLSTDNCSMPMMNIMEASSRDLAGRQSTYSMAGKRAMTDDLIELPAGTGQVGHCCSSNVTWPISTRSADSTYSLVRSRSHGAAECIPLPCSTDSQSASLRVNSVLPTGRPRTPLLDTTSVEQCASLDTALSLRGSDSDTVVSNAVRIAAMKQRRSFSGFGGGFVSFFEKMGRSLSSTDRLRRMSIDSGCVSPRAVVDSQACARRLSSAANCCGSATAACTTSSPDISHRVKRTLSFTLCENQCPDFAPLNGKDEGRITAASQKAEAMGQSVAKAQPQAQISAVPAVTGNGTDAMPSSRIWQLANERCDALLSLLDESCSAADPRSDRQNCGVQSFRSPAPANSHLLVSPKTSSASHYLAGTSYENSQDHVSTFRRRPPRKQLSSTPARASLIINELVQTEADYVAALSLVVEHYLPACELAAPMEPLHGQSAAIFGNIERLHDFHTNCFLAELCRRQHDPFSVGKCFLDHKTRFQEYALYIKNKPRSDSIMTAHGCRFFKARQEQLADLLDLGSYLLKPVQRLGKYALILQQLVKECSVRATCVPDGAQLHRQLQAAEDMVRFCLRHGDDLLALDSLYGCSLDLSVQGQLLRQEELTVIREKRKSSRQVFLFEKVIIFSKVKRVEKGHDLYKYKECLQMDGVGLTETVGTNGLRFELWQQRSRGSSWVIEAASSQAKLAWVKDIGHMLWAQARTSKQKLMAERCGTPQNTSNEREASAATISKQGMPDNAATPSVSFPDSSHTWGTAKEQFTGSRTIPEIARSHSADNDLWIRANGCARSDT